VTEAKVGLTSTFFSVLVRTAYLSPLSLVSRWRVAGAFVASVSTAYWSLFSERLFAVLTCNGLARARPPALYLSLFWISRREVVFTPTAVVPTSYLHLVTGADDTFFGCEEIGIVYFCSVPMSLCLFAASITFCMSTVYWVFVGFDADPAGALATVTGDAVKYLSSSMCGVLWLVL